MSLSQRLCLLPLLALSLSHAQSSSTLSLFMLENAVSWSSAYDCTVDNAARSITLEVSYGTQLDSLRFAGMKAIDKSTPKLYDQAGKLLPQHSNIKLDASLKAQFDVVSEDGSSQSPYTLSILRKSPSTSTKPFSLQLADDASNIAAVFDFDTESYIDSVQGIIHLKLSSIDPLNLSRLHVHALTSQYEPMPVLLALGDTLHKDEYLELDEHGEASLLIQAEDGHTQAYTLSVERPPQSPVTALSALRIGNTSRWDSSAVFPGLSDYGITARLKNTGSNTIDTAKNQISIEVPFRSPLDLGKVLIVSLQAATSGATLGLVDKNGNPYSARYYSFLADPDTSLYVKAENGDIRAYTLEVRRAAPTSSTRPSSLRLYDDAGLETYVNEDALDTAQGIISVQLPSASRLDMASLHLQARDAYGYLIPLLSAPEDTLEAKDKLALNSLGQASLWLIAEDGHTQAYILSISKQAPSTNTLPHSLTLQDSSLHSFTAYAFKDCLYCIDSLEHTVTFRLGPEDTLDLKAISLSALAKDGNGMTLLGPDSAVLADYYPIELDSLGRFSFYVKAQDGTLQAYALQFNLPAVKDPERLSPALAPILGDWRLALAASHGEASLHGLDGRLLWSATLPQSLEAVEYRRRAYTGPLMLRVGGAFYRLPPLPR